MPEVRVLTRTTAFGYYDHNSLAWSSGSPIIWAGARPPHCRASACGSCAPARWCWRPARSSGRWCSPTTTGPASCWRAPCAAISTAMRCVAGRRPWSSPTTTARYRTAPRPARRRRRGRRDRRPARRGRSGPAATGPRRPGSPILAGHAIVGSQGQRRVSAVEIAPAEARRATGSRAAPRPSPATWSASPAAGARPCTCTPSPAAAPRYEPARGVLRARRAEPRPSARPARATAPSALAGLPRRGRGGRRAAAAEAAGFDAPRMPELPAPRSPTKAPADALLWLVPSERPLAQSGKQFVDLQNDVTAADLALALREGYRSIEHVKRYTTTGMGTDQGKTATSTPSASSPSRRPADRRSVGVTTFRPPYTPVTFGAFAGRDVRRSAGAGAHHADACLARAPGAVFEDVGQWKRPWYYPREGEDLHGAVAREVKARARPSASSTPSTLGKIDLQGRGRRRAPQPRLHQRLEQAGGRALPLRPDAERGRHGDRRRRHLAPRRGPLPDDHDNRRRGARAGLWRNGCRPSGRSSRST